MYKYVIEKGQRVVIVSSSSSSRTYHDEVTLLGPLFLECFRDALGVQDALETIHRLVIVPIHCLHHLFDLVTHHAILTRESFVREHLSGKRSRNPRENGLRCAGI